MNLFTSVKGRLWSLCRGRICPPHGIQPHKYELFQEIKAGPIEGWITGIEYTPPSLVKAQDGWVEGWSYSIAAYLGFDDPVDEYSHNVVQYVSEDEIEGVLT